MTYNQIIIKETATRKTAFYPSGTLFSLTRTFNGNTSSGYFKSLAEPDMIVKSRFLSNKMHLEAENNGSPDLIVTCLTTFIAASPVEYPV